MRIGELAAATGVSTRSIRHYETQGLLPSSRTTNRYREFDASAIEVIRRIVLLLECGLPLGEIKFMEPCLPLNLECAKACPPLRTTLQHHRSRLEHRRDSLTKALALLDSVLLNRAAGD